MRGLTAVSKCTVHTTNVRFSYTGKVGAAFELVGSVVWHVSSIRS